ncbi:hypothetical protein NKG05_02085 [Oerskovia sp. M15]
MDRHGRSRARRRHRGRPRRSRPGRDARGPACGSRPGRRGRRARELHGPGGNLARVAVLAASLRDPAGP